MKWPPRWPRPPRPPAPPAAGAVTMTLACPQCGNKSLDLDGFELRLNGPVGGPEGGTIRCPQCGHTATAGPGQAFT